MVSLLIAFVVSLFACGLIIRLSRARALAWADDHQQGVQKFHAGAVPRVGGVANAVNIIDGYNGLAARADLPG